MQNPWLRKHRPGNIAGGGVAIFFKNNIECAEINVETTSVESQTVKLKNNLVISSVYTEKIYS